MTTTKGTTRELFDSLQNLYKQGQLLLMDADKFMGEEGWTPMHYNAIAELSYSINVPHKWFTRWAMRFYMPAVTEGERILINHVPFISIHFASDVKTGLETDVDEPLVCAGWLIYKEPMTPKKANLSYGYWMCKYWFLGERHSRLEGWRETTGSRWWHDNLKHVESFAVALYDITSSEKLKQLVIEPLLAVQEKERDIT